MEVRIPQTGATIKLAFLEDGVRVQPDANFDYEDQDNIAGLSTLIGMMRNGHMVVPLTKQAVVVVPGGNQQAQLATQVPDAGPDVPQMVPVQQFQQLQQQVQQVQAELQQMQQAMGGQAQPAPAAQPAPQPAAPPSNAGQPAPAQPSNQMPADPSSPSPVAGLSGAATK